MLGELALEKKRCNIIWRYGLYFLYIKVTSPFSG